jgi:hypothetical protein
MTDDVLTFPMPEPCEVRCNKIASVRVWDKIILSKISEIAPNALSWLINRIKASFLHHSFFSYLTLLDVLPINKTVSSPLLIPGIGAGNNVKSFRTPKQHSRVKTSAHYHVYIMRGKPLRSTWARIRAPGEKCCFP